MGSSGGLYFPIKLRCADSSVLFGNTELAEAVSRRLKRAFATARASLPEQVASGDGIKLNRPELVTGELPENEKRALLSLIRGAVERAARDLSLTGAQTPATFVAKIQPSEIFDPSRFDPRDVSYEVPSYRGGKAKVPAKTDPKAFESLLVAFTVVIHLLEELLASQRSLGASNDARAMELEITRRQTSNLDDERNATKQVAEIYAGRLRLADVPDDNYRKRVEAVVELYRQARRATQKTSGHPQDPPDSPDLEPRLVAFRKSQLELATTLINIVRLRLDRFDSEAAKHKAAGEDFAVDATIDVGTYYLALLNIKISESFRQLLFLDVYYSDPQVILSFAVIRYVRSQLPMLWENLQFAGGRVLGRIETANLDEWDKPSDMAISRAILLQNAVNDKEGNSLYGDLPRTASDLLKFPDRQFIAWLSAQILRLQVEVPLVRMLDLRQRLSEAMAREEYVGTSFFELSRHGDNDRKKWLKDLSNLRTELEKEFDAREHPDFEAKVGGWENLLNDLQQTIYKEIRNIHIRQMIGEQLLFLFVGGGITTGVGAWVFRISSGSRWLVVLAEAATLTAFNVGVRAAASHTAPTASGIAIQFGTNLALVGLGQIFRVLGAGLKTATGISSLRRVLALGGLTVGGLAATTALQTSLQYLEASAEKKAVKTASPKC